MGRDRAGDVVVTQGTGGVSLLARPVSESPRRHGDLDVVVGRQAEVRRRARRRPRHQLPDHPGLGGRSPSASRAAAAPIWWSTSVAPETLGHSVRATRMDGTVAIIGVLSGFGGAEIPVCEAMMQQHSSHRHHRRQRARPMRICRDGDSAAQISRRQPLLGWDEIPEAMRVMQANEHVGKIAHDHPVTAPIEAVFLTLPGPSSAIGIYATSSAAAEIRRRGGGPEGSDQELRTAYRAGMGMGFDPAHGPRLSHRDLFAGPSPVWRKPWAVTMAETVHAAVDRQYRATIEHAAPPGLHQHARCAAGRGRLLADRVEHRPGAADRFARSALS